MRGLAAQQGTHPKGSEDFGSVEDDDVDSAQTSLRVAFTMMTSDRV